jgi:hypothetical protein
MSRMSYLENDGNHELERAQPPAHRSHRCQPWGFRSRPGAFFGLGTENMRPKIQVAVALSVLVPVLLSGVLLVALVPGLWWIFTTYGWVSLPAFGLLAHGLAGLNSAPSGKRRASITAEGKERELLRALAEHGELSPVRAAMETSLSVAEVDRQLKELVEDGHLEVRVRGGGLFYSLWKSESGDLS